MQENTEYIKRELLPLDLKLAKISKFYKQTKNRFNRLVKKRGCDYGEIYGEIYGTRIDYNDKLQVKLQKYVEKLLAEKLCLESQIDTIENDIQDELEDKTNEEKLIYSARNGYFEIVKYLIEIGVDVHTNNDAALAASKYWPKITKYLIQQGANINVTNNC